MQDEAHVEGVPDWVRAQMKEPEPTVDESCLELIDEELLNSLMKFQREGVCFGIARNGRFFLGDDMGLGKTRQALAIADFYKVDWPLLIITTDMQQVWWQQEIIKLLPKVNELGVQVMDSSRDLIRNVKVLICSYSSLEDNMKWLMLKDFGMVILDESHNIKYHNSHKRVNATRLCEKAKHVIMISESPELSKPAELFPQLFILDPKFANFFNFTKRYCNGHTGKFGWEFTGSTHLDELNCFLRKRFMIRRTKDEVFLQLDEKNRNMVELKDMILSKKEIEFMKGFSEMYHSAEGKKQTEILLQWNKETAKLKGDAVCCYLKEFLRKNNEKCLIFVHNPSLMEAVTSCLIHVKVPFMCIEGSTKSSTCDSNIERFQNDPLLRCAILSIKACSTSITLTKVSTVIYAELNLTRSTTIQTEACSNRNGQDRRVTCIYLIAPKTADEVIWKLLQDKQPRSLATTGEHLPEKTAFAAGPSKPKIDAKITNYLTPITSFSDNLYTCETVGQENSDDIGAGTIYEEKLNDIAPVDEIVFDDNEDFDI